MVLKEQKLEDRPKGQNVKISSFPYFKKRQLVHVYRNKGKITNEMKIEHVMMKWIG